MSGFGNQNPRAQLLSIVLSPAIEKDGALEKFLMPRQTLFSWLGLKERYVWGGSNSWVIFMRMRPWSE